MTALCSDDAVQDVTRSAGVVSAVLAIVRYHGIHKSWDYEEQRRTLLGTRL